MVDVKKIKSAVRRMFSINLGLQDGEGVLVVTDRISTSAFQELNLSTVVEYSHRAVLAKAVHGLGSSLFPRSNFSFHVFPSVMQSGKELDLLTAQRMKEVDVVIAITNFSLSHTDARRNASKAGVRVASMPRFEEQMFYHDGPMSVDYRRIARVTQKLAETATQAQTASVTTPYGTDLNLTLGSRLCEADTGLLQKVGEFGNLPAGEAYMAPISAEGQLVVLKGWHPRITSNLTMKFRKGKAVQVRGGGKEGKRIKAMFEENPSRAVVAELGIGTNPNAQNPLNVLEAEKILGTVHIAVGDNTSFPGGDNPSDIHWDFVQPKPTLIFEDTTIIRRGKYLLSK